MLHPESLINKSESWQFASEADLEDFVWNNLEKLFGLLPLKRQYIVLNDCCDILALSDSGQIVIIELKNTEDRYVVQQLTRYYHSLATEKPMAEIIKYDQPIRLIAIKPYFHRHNYIDQVYNKLTVEFWQFEIIQTDKQLTFHIKNQEEITISSTIIPYPQEYILDEIIAPPTLRILPRIPRVFEKLLDERHPSDKDLVLKIREKLLDFDERMAEVNTKVITRYGYLQKNGSIPITKMCAEVYSRSINNKFYELNFSLWLPIPNQRYISQNIYQKKTEKILVWAFNKENSKLSLNVLRNPDPKSYRHSESYSLNQYLKIYKLMTGREITNQSLEGLIEIALADWQERVDSKIKT
jgi:hypothetical protein